MTESASPADPITPPGASGAELLAVLRSLLSDDGKKIASENMDEVARKVNLLAVHLPKEQDDSLALQFLAVIGLASAKGSKEAAKRKPNLARWANEPPPSLQVLSSKDERVATIKLLAAQKSPWAIRYALREAADERTSKDLVPDFLKWASAASVSQADFLGGLADVLGVLDATSVDRRDLVLKLGLKAIAESDAEASMSFPNAFEEFCAAVGEACRQPAATPAKSLALLGTALGVLDVVSAREPAVLVTPLSLRGLAILAELPGGWPKSLHKLLTSLARRVISVALFQVRIHGLEGSAEVRRILSIAGQVLPIGKVAARFVSESQAIKGLLAPLEDSSADVTPNVSADSGVQDQVAALLGAWDALSAKLADPGATREVESLLQLVAAKANVDRLGTRGEIVPFQPLQHYLITASAAPPSNVRIETPGVKAVRSDGSYRVLTRALVNPAT
jgi:hypothetical protein